MHEVSSTELVTILALLAVGGTLLAVAPRLRIPYPILLVLGGLALSLFPGIPTFELNPDLVLFGILPPLLYSAAFFTGLRDLRRNRRPVGLLAFGLVLMTTFAVAAVGHTLLDLSWSSAFVLGAVVSPTDPVAATAISQRLGAPRRLIVIVEGESLVNDATALVALRVAVLAVVGGSFSLWHAGWLFALNVVGGVAVGLAVGYLVRQARKRIDDVPAEITVSLLTGYFAFIPASLLGVSGVLAVVVAGVYLGWHTPELTTPEVRLIGNAMWRLLTFVLNALLFVLVGLQLPVVLDALDGVSRERLARDALIVAGAVIAARFIWIYPATYLPRWLSRRIRETDPSPPWQYPTFVGWNGMRGAVSLAAALSIPLTTDAGAAFPGRDLIVYLTFAVILATLVVQGLTLPVVIRLLGLEDDGIANREEAKARILAADAALERLEELALEDWVNDDTAERLRGAYGFRRRRFAARFDDGDDGAIEARSQAYQRLRRELLAAERRAVLDLRRTGRISDEAMHAIERDLDLEDQRLDI
jgi:CPA1 family monovalent cation:H+ antiporter